jgi:acetolactate decarboxylase
MRFDRNILKYLKEPAKINISLRLCASAVLKNSSICLITVLALSACNYQPQVQVAEQEQALYQIATIDALLQGFFDGHTTLSELATKGDFGIGTFNTLDGEMVLEDGLFFQVKADGKVYRPSAETQTPFASVVKFAPEDSLEIQNMDYPQLQQLIDSLMKSPNYFYAIRVEGEFESVHTRSVPAQQKPYPQLVVVTRNQPEFNIEKTSGKLTGFYCPEFVKGVNIPGYHLHYLTDDKTAGGHLLGFQLKSGMLKLDRIEKFEMQLPSSGDFQKSEFKTDRSSELKEVEG